MNSTYYFKENNIEVFLGITMKKVFDHYEVIEKEGVFTTTFGASLLNGEKVQDETVDYLCELISFDINAHIFMMLWKSG